MKTSIISPVGWALVLGLASLVGTGQAVPVSTNASAPQVHGAACDPPPSSHRTANPNGLPVLTSALSGLPATNEPVATNEYPRPVQNLLEAQVAMDRLQISSGSIDGVSGPQTRAALLAFQREGGLPQSGALDAATREALVLERPALTNYAVSAADLSRLQPLSPTWLGKSRQSRLDYPTILELVAEKGHAHPRLIRRLNPELDWTTVPAGTVVRLPDTTGEAFSEKAEFITISLGQKVLEAFDSQTNLLVHFPCSIAQRVEKRPVGQLAVAVVAPNPNYTFDPALFPESAEAQSIHEKLILPPGPRNPVGIAWIGLDRPGYGIHGTPSPEQVGRTESHGCFRLANWNAERLLHLVEIDTPVCVQP